MATGYTDMDYDVMERLQGEELDRLREVLVYILMKDTEIDVDEVYSLVFQNGASITWH
ncbi:hypothetical protein LCGC14_2915310 [marine sediment metagenome]|uniref:Uncharacterized protein n=1 Tax=marine sediment metagenome TaxID=412755 RepID=A0A0F8XQP0_9ZZZZ